MATSTFLRASAACAVAAMNFGAKPRLTSARLPFLRKMRRVIIRTLRVGLALLEFRRPEGQGDELLRRLGPGERLPRAIGDAAGEHHLDQPIARRVARVSSERRQVDLHGAPGGRHGPDPAPGARQGAWRQGYHAASSRWTRLPGSADELEREVHAVEERAGV